jgi:two-component system, NtrC family, response regulator HydG
MAGVKPADSTEVEFDSIVPLEQMEQRYLQWAACNYPGDRQSLAAKLGVSERTLYRKLQHSTKSE